MDAAVLPKKIPAEEGDRHVGEAVPQAVTHVTCG